MSYSMHVIEELMMDNWARYHNDVLPNGRHFEPSETFNGVIEGLQNELKFTMLIDCGAGEGHVAKALKAHGIKCAACDIIRRECHVGVEVQIIPAHKMPLDENIWPLVCRPDHSGWCGALFQRAMRMGSGFLYAGHVEKMVHDVTEMEPATIYEGVGKDREVLAVWEPIPDLEEYLQENEPGYMPL